MILQYKGFNNNWTYEEADVITYAMVNVDEITSKYRDYKDLDTHDLLTNVGRREFDLQRARKMQNEVDEYICKQTNAANIVYHIGNLKFTNMTSILVVMLDDKNKHVTRVFDNVNTDTSVYLLNGKGQTVQKLV